MVKQRKFLLIVAGIGVISTFLPWFQVSAGGFGIYASKSLNGFREAGIFYFLLMLAMGTIAYLGNREETLPKNMRLAVLGTGAGALISLVIALSQIKGMVDTGYGMVDLGIGFGFYLSVLVSIATIVVPLVLKGATEGIGDDWKNLVNKAQTLQQNVSARPEHKNKMSELEQLMAWRQEDKITDQEFQELKSKLFNP